MALAPSLHSLVHSTAVTILQHDLPGLPEIVAQEVATFTVRRLGVLAAHMRLGVAAIALLVRLFASWSSTVGGDATDVSLGGT